MKCPFPHRAPAPRWLQERRGPHRLSRASLSRLPPQDASGDGDIVRCNLKQVVINIVSGGAFRRRNDRPLVSIASNRVGSPLDRELRAEDASLRGKLFDDDIATAGELPRVERCGTVHEARATRAFIEAVRDVADPPGGGPIVGCRDVTRQHD